ncbi:DUF5641 domain-containing protein [Trichonephila clavipes]|nr:DUF5641 domain-containing protein [Trichonephila clavipes]
MQQSFRHASLKRKRCRRRENLPQPSTRFSPYGKRILNATKLVYKDSIKNALEKAIYENEDNNNNTVAVDGAWQKRGYTSLNGVVTVTSIDSILDSLFKDSKSNCQTQTVDHFQARKKNSENNKEVKNEEDQNLTVKETDYEKITSPAIEKIQELIADLQNSLKSGSKIEPSPSNFSTLATQLENPAKKGIPATKISTSSEEDSLKNSKTSPALVQIQELIFDLQNSLK